MADELSPLGAVVLEVDARTGSDEFVEALGAGDVRDADPEVIDPAFVADGTVVDGFGAVAVGSSRKAP